MIMTMKSKTKTVNSDGLNTMEIIIRETFSRLRILNPLPWTVEIKSNVKVGL